jgi:hypothetical protein
MRGQLQGAPREGLASGPQESNRGVEGHRRSRPWAAQAGSDPLGFEAVLGNSIVRNFRGGGGDADIIRSRPAPAPYKS